MKFNTTISTRTATGSGKSSLINALLGAEIVPTSGQSACTSVPIKLSYRRGPGIAAEVELISLEDWRGEIELCLGDLRQEDGRVGDVVNDDAEIGRAYAKISAVYPVVAHMSKETLEKLSVEDLIASNPDVVALLQSSPKKFEAVDAAAFRTQVHPYLSSDVHSSDADSSDVDPSDVDVPVRGQNEQSMLWPLVVEVSIRCSSPILSTGLVLLDLPGEVDANAARQSVSQRYKKKCNHMGIVTHAVRAKDDATAHALMNIFYHSSTPLVAKESTDLLMKVLTLARGAGLTEEITKKALIYKFQQEIREIASDLDETASINRRSSNASKDIVPSVFNISARDYCRITNIITGDGGPQTFSRVDDTNIPALRDYLMQLAQPRSEKGINKLEQLVDVLHTSLLQYLDTANTDEEHRLQKARMLKRWDSQLFTKPESSQQDAVLLFQVAQPTGPRVEDLIRPRLKKTFSRAAELAASESQTWLQSRLKLITARAAQKAERTAPAVFKISLENVRWWSTLNAILRRDGQYGTRSLNEAILEPYLQALVSSYISVFEKDFFKAAKQDISKAVDSLLQDVNHSVVALQTSIKKDTSRQCDSARQLAENRLAEIEDALEDILDAKRQEVSSTLEPQIQAKMRPAYVQALEERGPGSLKRRKAVLQEFVKKNLRELYGGNADVLSDGFAEAGDLIEAMLEEKLDLLAEEGLLASTFWYNSQHLFGDTPSAASSTLFVGNLSFDATEDLVWESFSEYGEIKSVRLPTDCDTGRPKGFGYDVEFSDIETLKKAYDGLTGSEITGRSDQVRFFLAYQFYLE
ncbi:hypothetical protein PHLCEN_2v11269 [Hermanssonia centrifuga]|uniref:RRM domain-containing protein n=1 Tax=Hermanssonia centrifuga TaxID=98765 RepID=A0A2R6NLL5_9APHY|nr:hypothetical protein PHLCEN_2v11269 [Hermanssonia centrifuga]